MTWSVSAREPLTIETEDPCSEPMEFAAAELARYLARVLGRPIPAVAVQAGPLIVIGKVNDPGLGDEGYELSVANRTLAIRGGGDAGVVYGVYEFLRRGCGCRFSGLGPDGEHVPRRTHIELKDSSIRMKPRLWYRGLQLSSPGSLALVVQWLDWMAKNGLNYVIYRPQPDAGGRDETFDPATGELRTGSGYTQEWFDRFVRPEVHKRGLKLDMNHHNLFYWLPPAKYFEQHPEWYAEVDGQRLAEAKQLCICTSNDEAVETLIENMRQYLRRNPDVKIAGVIPEDGWGMCQCDKCAAGDLDPDDRFKGPLNWRESGGTNRSKVERYARLLNQVARGIRDEFPEVLVGGAAYIDLTPPPETVPLESSTAVWVAIYWRDSAHVMAEDSPSVVNRHFFKLLKKWRQTYRGRLITYSYYMGMNAQKSLPYPMDRTICRDWPVYKAIGVEGATIQCWPSNHDVYSLNLLAFARNGWHDDVDPDELLDEYLEGMFGAAADAVRPIFDAFHDAWRRAEAGAPGELRANVAADPKYPTSRGVAIIPNGRSIVFLLDVLGRDRLGVVLEQARAAATEDRERRQVAKLAAARYWQMAAEVFQLERQIEDAREKGDEATAQSARAQALQQIDAIAEYLDSLPPGWGAATLPRGWKRMRETVSQLDTRT